MKGINFTKKNVKDDTYYFQWVSIMLYIKDNQNYANIRNVLSEQVKMYFENNRHKFESTVFILFWGDYLSCPFVDSDDKVELVKSYTGLKNENNIKAYINEYFGDNEGLIVDWKENDWLVKSIDKRFLNMIMNKLEYLNDYIFFQGTVKSSLRAKEYFLLLTHDRSLVKYSTLLRLLQS